LSELDPVLLQLALSELDPAWVLSELVLALWSGLSVPEQWKPVAASVHGCTG